MKTRCRIILALTILLGFLPAGFAASVDGPQTGFPKPLEDYQDEKAPGVMAKLAHRIQTEPINLVGTLIFLAAIVHTFVTARFMRIAHHFDGQFHALEDAEKTAPTDPKVLKLRDRLLFRAQLFHFLGEVEAVFGIWLVPLFLAIILMKGWDTLVAYMLHINAAEPVFVVVAMAMASSRPILFFAERCLAKIASVTGSTVGAWWMTILTVGPLLGSLITEPAAMTICALLLRQKLYDLKPSFALRYATLALLFVNVSIGGTLSHFAAPPVVMVATRWDWDLPFMLTHFGWKATLGILIGNVLYYLRFRRELSNLRPAGEGPAGSRRRPVPPGLIITHLAFIAWTVLVAHYTLLVVIGFLFFLAFVEATRRHQSLPSLRSPLLVGFFLLALVIHGGCQRWWIAPVLSSLPGWPLMIGATLLTALNDNAAITYLASLVPGFHPGAKYAVVAGAIAGGGLTVIANAPNPAGQAMLISRFGSEGISPLKLLLWAIPPTIIAGGLFMLIR
ncbi:MAG: putative Na+/H+ antiporter [Verrucomicrobia bacterium]|nr:putative Na+/H+ antiporter [Verrucomicrobiota bacterium]